jgi:hypothetical protein
MEIPFIIPDDSEPVDENVRLVKNEFDTISDDELLIRKTFPIRFVFFKLSDIFTEIELYECSNLSFNSKRISSAE